MSNPCGTDITVAGPFPQTLFMGLSIRSFNLNLGWGGEASSCTVKLVYDPAHHWSHSSYSAFNNNITSKLGQSTATRASTSFDPQKLTQQTPVPDTNLSLHTGPAQKLKDGQQARQNAQSDAGTTGRNDTGKKIWQVGVDTPIDWLGPDPGFLADDLRMLRDIAPNSRNLDIMGSLVHFRYDNVIFNGVVKNWNYNNGLVDVTLDSPTNLVKGTKLILKDYTGTISSTINGATFGNGASLAVPYDDSSISAGFNATIYNGNIPNLINVFGYLGFENIGYSESRGVSLGLVYDGVTQLIGGAGPVKNKWNPYGCIIGKAVRDRNNAAYLNHSTTLGTTFGTYAANHWNIFNTRTAVDGIFRPHIGLDLSDVPRPPNEVYINDVSISLVDFIDKCCEPLGFDYWFELQNSRNANYDAFIKVHTVSRRFQPPVNIIKNLVQSFDESDFVTDYKFGQEFQDAKTRTVVMGGKQQRLFQTGTNNLGRYRNRRVYEPSLDHYVNYQVSSRFNYSRTPDTAKYRNLTGQPYYNIDGAVVAQTAGNNFNVTEVHPQNGQSILRGSYKAIENSAGLDVATAQVLQSNYSLGENDLIKPFMGQDVYGNNRETFFAQGDTNGYLGEMFVQVSTADLSQYFPAQDAPNLSGNVSVSETEIRAAMGGYDSWLNYIFEMPVLGKPIGMASYIYVYLRDKYGSTFATSFFLNALNIFSGDKSKLSTLPAPRTGAPVSVETFLPYSEALYPILSALHGFFADMGNNYYGKTYLVRLPNVTSFVDADGIRHYNYEVCDRAWEEAGNFIDDTIQIGGSLANQIANEDGTFGALLAYDNSAEYDAFTDLSNQTPNGLFDPTSIAIRMKARTAAKNPNNWYWPLIHNIPRQDVFYCPYKQQIIPGTEESVFGKTINPVFPTSYYGSAHGFTPPNNSKWKMYVRANAVSLNPEAVNTDSNLTFYYGQPHCVLAAPSPVYSQTPTNLSKVMMEEMLVFTRDTLTSVSAANRQARYAYLLQWSMAEAGLEVSSTNLSNQVGNRQNLGINLKAAHPLFAAVPLKSNVSSYGPWTSHPGLGHSNDNTLFTDPNPISQINNLVGEANFTHEPDAQPWNYGGIHNLDDAMLTKIKDSNYYQQVLEAGYVTMAGVLFLNSNLGSRLVANGPIINSLSVQIGDDGFTTTYNMRTYNRKLGFFNKDSAELIQQRGRDAITSRQKNAYALRQSIISNSSMGGGGNIGGGGGGGNVGGGGGGNGRGYNIQNLLVGGAGPYLHGTSTLTSQGLYAGLGFDPGWAYRPVVPQGQSVSPEQFPMQKSVTMIFDEQSVGNMLAGEFDKKSVMSLDGIFSPVSFYPTPYGGTFPMTFYHRSKCPICQGNGTYTYEQFIPPGNGGSTADAQNGKTLQTRACFFCKPDATANTDKGVDGRASPSLITPPVIITDSTDDDSEAMVARVAGNKINKFTLNPIIMKEGEFSLKNDAKAVGDNCGHSIDVVGFGESAPALGQSLRATNSNSISSNYADGVNQRFFGLRGPIVVHGWGYDKEGYPVPNGSGELKTLEDGTVVSVTQTIDDDGNLTEPYKLNRFYQGWGQNPGTWPVGPIDLRWDNDAGVWTVGSQYKNIWVTIEVDLKGTQPTRGVVYGTDAEALPAGTRRLVFVRDSSGGYAAPRGANIYCQYDPDSGYYIPLYNQALVASGVMESDSSAKIYQSYKKDYDEDNPTYYTATFDNFLGFETFSGKNGLFTYVNGKWVLQSVK